MTVGPDVPGEFLSRDSIRHRPFPGSERFRDDLIREVSEVVDIILERRKAQAMAAGNADPEVAVSDELADTSEQKDEGSVSGRGFPSSSDMEICR